MSNGTLATLIFTLFFGCVLLFSANEPAAEAKEKSLPKGFVLVSDTKIGTQTVHEIKHSKTGCHFISTEDIKSGGGFVQMYVNVNNTAIPYCDKSKGDNK
ncbi:hypothetical protein [Lysinibacillus sp. FSL K6-0102]|uniref:hypothetical protein n=1 Tax=Lysinibacillus sp. FSL K6-0102 TaxID=2975290 RepID=UPI0028E45DFB|nr:hypothetical protein [uncultured Lysinibacillus sp.]